MSEYVCDFAGSGHADVGAGVAVPFCGRLPVAAKRTLRETGQQQVALRAGP